MKHALALALSASLLAAPALADMRPGKWQIVMKNTAEGQQPSDMTMTQCMDGQQLQMQSGSAGAPEGKKNEDYDVSGNDGGCSYRSWRKGETMHMESTCDGETTVTDATHKADSYTLKSVVTNKEGKMVSEITGTRLGDC